MLKNHKGLIIKIRDSRTFKGLAVCLALNIFVELTYPTVSMALTEGPSQPEVQSFEPIGTTQMVDPFTGDFNYNIPLFNLPGPNGGYPVNIAYHAGISMDDEASWVGLGWNINAGSLVRNMRGLPDEFLTNQNMNLDETDYLEIKSDMKQSWTLGASVGLGLEIVGAPIDNIGQSADMDLSFSLYYNNYRGLGVGSSITSDVAYNSNFSLGLSLDSENGLGLSAGLKQSTRMENTKLSHNLGVNFNGSLGVDYSLTMSDTKKVDKLGSGRGKNGNIMSRPSISVISASHTFASNSFIPSVQNKIDYYNLSARVKFGIEAGVADNTMSIGVFYNTQDYNDEFKKGKKIPVIGYDQAGKNNYNQYTRDFMRLNDGQITPQSIILPNSYYTYDSYYSTGQGLSGYFRPKRTDIGAAFDPYNKNESWGLDLGLDLSAGGLAKIGVNVGVNFGWETQGKWEEKNDLSFDFLNPETGGIDEVLYYQAHGEQTLQLDSDLSYLGGLNLAKVTLQPKNSDDASGGHREINASVIFDNDGHNNANRFVRNTTIQPFTNEEVAHLGEFDIKYFGLNDELDESPSQVLNRETRGSVNIDKHKAGFKVLNGEGSTYVYGLPAYNLKEVENLFSVAEPNNPGSVSEVDISMSSDEVDYKVQGSNSHKFINKTTKSPYAHSYLLTSVLGADYVDITNNGPTNDDLGYWVKFEYKKASDNYKWRAPYNTGKAKYHRNATYTSSDDKGSYNYGEKEIWYLARIETKSHIAVFETGSRVDNAEASGENPISGTTSTSNGLRLNKIKIYEKNNYSEESVPLQTIDFGYSYQLCNGAENSSSGKLTLKDITFNSMGSSRGDLSKYEFGYAGVEGVPGLNMNYNKYAFDGWGSYKQLSGDPDLDEHFPYTNQFQQGLQPQLDGTYSTGVTNQEIQDLFTSAWCLKKIKLPSGGTINVEYESDDYAYVQHKLATQMFKITSVNELSPGDDELYENGDNNFYDTGTTIDERRRRIHFKLEIPIPVATSNIPQRIYDDYVEPIIADENGDRNLFFKARTRLIKNPDVYDYVSGYLPLERNLVASGSVYNYNVDEEITETINGVSCYKYGYVTVQPGKKKNGEYFDNYHPMSLAAWTYLQTNAPDLLNNPNSFNSEEETNEDNFLGKVGDIVNVIPMLASSFGAIRSYCKNKDMARYIDIEKSCIRLASPDRKKFGGGHRVKQISISDNWASDTEDDEPTRTYGMVYEYTTTDETGRTISSGVAQYEPQAIGDEIALKYPIYFYGRASTFTNNNLFAEAPVNEALFPGPSVGYSKVTTKSLNTDTQLKNAPVDQRGRTSGITVSEFFTAKDFPTLVSWTLLSENQNTKDKFNVPIPIPFIGIIKRTYYHGTQAFMIETNDMHGKPKSTKTFEINGFDVNPNPITESTHEYQCTPISYQGEKVWKLDNYVDVIPNNGTHEVSNTKRLMGVEVDLFTDQRESKNFSQGLGLDMNIDLPAPPAFIPSVWPSFSNVKSMFRSYVTNKIVHRSGILKKTKVRDLQTVNESEILAYDEKSGTPLLTKVKNEFGDEFFNYNIPAYYHYDRMGHAYKNINFNFTSSLSNFTITSLPEGHSESFVEVPASGLEDYLVRGDELIITSVPEGSNQNNMYKKAYFIGWAYQGGNTVAKLHLIDPESGSNAGNYKFKVIRSGRRNHYSSVAASYVTKGEFSALLTDDLTLETGVTTPVIENNVLSATASLYKDDWSTSSRGVTDPLYTKNPFITGNSGIWRPYKSYTYVGERKGNADLADNQNSTGNPKLYEDGLMENVPMFSFDIGSMENYESNWEWVNEVTRFSGDAYEIENMNRLGINSSALYGYDNSLTIAVGGNADMHEIAACDFETSVASNLSKLLLQTNFNFDHDHEAGSIFVTEKHNVRNAVAIDPGIDVADVEVLTDIPYNGSMSVENLGNEGMFLPSCALELISKKTGIGPTNEGYYFNGLIRGISNVDGFVKFDIKVFLENVSDPKHLLQIGSTHHGKITLLYERDYLAGPTADYSTVKAHTGKYSMKVDSDIVFDQPKLMLKTDKPYVVSMWVSRDNVKVANFNPQNLVSIGTMTGSTFNALTPTKINVSKVIEGWQKIDFEFSIDSNLPVLAVKFIPGSTSLYVDDIRFSPKTGGLTSYVYDSKNYRLLASLNVDNYATLFYYDEEGNLTIKKQETEEGIFTITESRGHVSED